MSQLMSQFRSLLLLFLQRKAWRTTAFVFPVALSLSHLLIWNVISANLKKFDKLSESTSGLKFYSTPDFVSSGHKVLVDRSSFPAETEALVGILKDRGSSADWLMECKSDGDCKAKFISESDSAIIGYIGYSKDPNERRATVECRWVEAPVNYRCPFLYYLMAQSMIKASNPDAAFKDVQFFSLNPKHGASSANTSVGALTWDVKNRKNVTLPASKCADLIHLNVFMFNQILSLILTLTLPLTTLGQLFYILFSSMSCIQSLKAKGFLRMLVRNGLSPYCYWGVIWLFTAVESCAIAAIYVASLALTCPGVFPALKVIGAFIYIVQHSFCFSALLFLVELFISSTVALYMIGNLFSMCLPLVYLYYDQIYSRAGFLTLLFPLLNTQNFTLSYLTAGVNKETMGDDTFSERESFHRNQLVAICVFTVLLIGLIPYLDFVLPKGNGLRLAPNFPFIDSFWNPKPLSEFSAREPAEDAVSAQNQPHIELVRGFSESIVVESVSKSYKSSSFKIKVLNGLSCKLYNNQITALIGHNGAGKSTLIKILTGEESTDHGTAYVNGVNVTDPIERLSLRGSVGICPQFDALCPHLTVLESILLTLDAMGARSEANVEKALGMLQKLGLGDKEGVGAAELSGGQSRKLNTILALLGDPRVVFLDEPTSGLDPVSRRQLWQLLQEEKLGRSIVLCTQFMDEADVLADRKIFLSGGQIVCAGSSLFLKRAFGCSFTLNVSLKSKSEAQRLMSTLKQVKLKNILDTELRIEVPASKPAILVEAVQTLEASAHVQAFGLSQATLDEIFIKLSGLSATDIITAFRSGEPSTLLTNSKSKLSDRQIDACTELAHSLGQRQELQPSFLMQTFTLLRTNLRRQVRTWKGLFNKVGALALVLIILGVMTGIKSRTYAKAASEAILDPELLSSGITRAMGDSSVRVFDKTCGSARLGLLCLHDPLQSHIFNKSDFNCLPMTLDYSNTANQTGSVSDYFIAMLSRNGTIEAIGEKCGKMPCVLIYASSWNRTEPNRLRSVAIGLFAPSFKHCDMTQAYRRAFANVSHQFQVGSVLNTTALSHVMPLSKFNWSDNMEVLIFALSIALYSIVCLDDPLEDFSSGVRGQMMSMGMTNLAYWINLFLLHSIQYWLFLIVCIALMCIVELYRNIYFLLVCLPVLFLGSTSNLLLVYFVAAVTRAKSSVVSILIDLTASVLPLVFLLMEKIDRDALLLLVCLMPPLAPVSLVYFSLLYLHYGMSFYNTANTSDIPDLLIKCWGSKHIYLPLIAIPIHICVMCGLIAAAENLSGIKVLFYHKPSSDESDRQEAASGEMGAQAEANRVMQSVRDGRNVLEVRELYKTYPNGVRAVRGVTFGTLAGEIFGLLGANGAGKTTCLSVIIGNELPSSGQCEVHLGEHVWVSGRRGSCSGAIGYCPQHNPLFDVITVTEHLKMYADIRGVPSSTAEQQTAALIQGLGLEPHRDKYANQLSGGNKRRLCLAIALLGNPALLVIDEASTGLDPESKRFIWYAIRGILHEQRSVIVTTHSMEEVEALCSRVGIMNNGRMIAVGTVQQLRSLYGDYYTLDILLKEATDGSTAAARKAAIKVAIPAQFEGATLVEDISLNLQFQVPKTSVSRLSNSLLWLSANETKLGVDFCTLCQMSLDQVFVKLVKRAP